MAAEGRYSIGEFSDMTGLSQSKIRYYQKLGLFTVRRHENGYRWFVPEDAFRVNAFRCLQGYGFTVERAIELLDKAQAAPEFIAELQERHEALLRERVLLESRIRCTEQALAGLNSKPTLRFSVEDCEDAVYVMASVGRDFTVAGQAGEAIAGFVELLPVSRYARIIQKEEILGTQECVNPCYITVLRKSDQKLLRVCSPAEMQYFSLGKCVVYTRCLTRAESVRRDSYAPLLAWLADHGYRLRGNVLLFPSFLNLDGRGTDVEKLMVPIL